MGSARSSSTTGRLFSSDSMLRVSGSEVSGSGIMCARIGSETESCILAATPTPASMKKEVRRKRVRKRVFEAGGAGRSIDCVVPVPRL